MANVKISDLAAFADPVADDVFPIVDTSADSTKKVTITTLMRSIPDGTVSAPAIAFRDDRNTGFYTPAANELGFVTGGVQRLVIDEDGNIGIGVGSPTFNYGGGLEIQKAGNTTLRLERTDATASAVELAATSGVVRLDVRTQSALAFHTDGTERMRIDSSGRLLVGTSSAGTDAVSTVSQLQVKGTSGANSAGSFTRYQNNAAGALLIAQKSRGASVGSHTIVQDNDETGRLIFAGSDGTNFITTAEIRSFVDGTPGTNDMPGRLTFRTTADGASSATERMRIDSSGNVGIGTTSPSELLHCVSTGDSDVAFFERGDASGTARIKIQSGDGSFGTINAPDGGNTLAFFTGTSERVRIDSSGNVGIGTTSPAFTYGGGLEIQRAADATLRLERTNATASALELTADSAATRLDTRTNTPMLFHTNATERLRITSTGRLLLGATNTPPAIETLTPKFALSSSSSALEQYTAGIYCYRNAGGSGRATVAPRLLFARSRSGTNNSVGGVVSNGDDIGNIRFAADDGSEFLTAAEILAEVDGTPGDLNMPGKLTFSTTASGASTPSVRMTIFGNGNIGFIEGVASGSSVNNRAYINASTGVLYVGADGTAPAVFNRNTNDGNVVQIRQANTTEGTISVSGTTVSYGGGHLSRWSQLAGNAERIEILRGSVLSNLDEMCEWGEEDNEQLNRMKVSDVEGDRNVAGVFQSWDDDDDTFVNDFYCAVTGDFVIRIAQGTTVARGDLLMSAGDGTAKPQDDDIVRSKTVAKVISTTVSTTYADGSYCVPCVLMAC